MKHKIQYAIFLTLEALFGGKKLRKKKLLAGILMMTSMASLLSCGGSGKNSCYVQATDSSDNKDTVIQTCYQAVFDPDTEYQEAPKNNNVYTPPAEIEEVTTIIRDDQPDVDARCYMPVNPEMEDTEHE
ncbi:MAG: hypothetical protein JXR53_08975 [Bacteroidales bacterium]|nr:hypothetical protein [Bacteroidales bacterium]